MIRGTAAKYSNRPLCLRPNVARGRARDDQCAMALIVFAHFKVVTAEHFVEQTSRVIFTAMFAISEVIQEALLRVHFCRRGLAFEYTASAVMQQ